MTMTYKVRRWSPRVRGFLIWRAKRPGGGITATRQGPPAEVLQFGEQPDPHAAAGQVRVKVHASGVNPADAYRRGGRNFPLEGSLVIPNSDGAGIVDEVGPGADPALLGRRVWLHNGQRNGRVLGTAAEYIAFYATRDNLQPVLPADNVMRRNLSIHGLVLKVARSALFMSSSALVTKLVDLRRIRRISEREKKGD